MPIILILFIISLLIYNLKIKKIGNKQIFDDYLSKEKEALFVRKKSLDHLEYIQPNLVDLPALSLTDQLTAAERKAYEKQLLLFETKNLTMIDLRGKNNTELKLEFGPANLETLIQYEKNYVLFLQQLLEWAESLIDANHKAEAISVLEKGISIGTDLSQNYILLADLYFEHKQFERLTVLLEKAQNLNSLMKGKIIHHINNLLKITE